MIEEKLHRLKEEYQGTPVPGYLVYDGWGNVRLKLADRSSGAIWIFARRIVLAVLFLAIIFSGVVGSSQAAAPGDFLYPVKVASQNLYAKMSGNYQKPIEYRTQDVVNSSGGQDGNLDEAIKQYENTLNQTKNRVSDEEAKGEFKKTLQAGQQQLRQAHDESDNEQDREKLEQVIEKTNKIQGEIRGARDSRNNSHLEQNKSGED